MSLCVLYLDTRATPRGERWRARSAWTGRPGPGWRGEAAGGGENCGGTSGGARAGGVAGGGWSRGWLEDWGRYHMICYHWQGARPGPAACTWGTGWAGTVSERACNIVKWEWFCDSLGAGHLSPDWRGRWRRVASAPVFGGSFITKNRFNSKI